MSSGKNESSGSEKPKRKEKEAKKSGDGIWTKLKGVVYPEFAQEGVRSSRAWKTFARCMIAVLCTMVLLVDNACELLRMLLCFANKKLCASWARQASSGSS